MDIYLFYAMCIHNNLWNCLICLEHVTLITTYTRCAACRCEQVRSQSTFAMRVLLLLLLLLSGLTCIFLCLWFCLLSPLSLLVHDGVPAYNSNFMHITYRNMHRFSTIFVQGLIILQMSKEGFSG